MWGYRGRGSMRGKGRGGERGRRGGGSVSLVTKIAVKCCPQTAHDAPHELH
jgi:hypothetical protein